MTKITKIASFFLLISGITFADPWRVPEDFPDGIQSAINYDDVVDGDTISVRQGTVQNPTIWYENIIFRSKDITVINRDFLPGGNNNPATCIIDGSELTRTSDSGSVVTFKDEESRDAVVKGFTIREGIGHLISEVRYGGGIFCYYSNPTVECCSIVNNSADWGGGIECNSSSPLIQYNMVRDDISNCAIHTQGACEAIIAENVITSNDHAGMWFDNGSPQVTANSITENQGYGIVASRCAGVFRRNTIQGNVIHGVYVTAFFPPDPEPDFGKTATSLGYNDIRGNEEYDFYNESDNPEVSAEGNYWGVIDSDSIRSNIFGNVDFDPILFYGDVDFWSRCYNIDVIVIGDITVKEIVGGIGGWLEISNGSLKFEPHSDTTKGGCDPNLCELIVFGEIIVNVATSFDYCYFISNSTSPQPGDWFGIRLMPGTGFNGIGVFRQSIYLSRYIEDGTLNFGDLVSHAAGSINQK